MESPHKLTKAEKRDLRKKEWENQLAKDQKMSQYKKMGLWTGLGIMIAVAIFGLAMLVNNSSNDPESSLVSPAKTDFDFATGSPSANVMLTEYGDFQCPACAGYNPTVKQLLEEEGNNIYFVYRYFPLTNIHKNAKISAQAGYAANKQGKFWEMFHILFERQDQWAENLDPRSIFIDYAKEIGLDTDKFNADMNSTDASKFVDDSLAAGNSVGLNSTPSFFINNKKIKNPASYAEFKKLIDEALAK